MILNQVRRYTLSALAAMAVAGVVVTGGSVNYVKYLAQQSFESNIAKVKQSFAESLKSLDAVTESFRSFVQLAGPLGSEKFQLVVRGAKCGEWPGSIAVAIFLGI